VVYKHQDLHIHWWHLWRKMKHGALCHDVTPALFWGWGSVITPLVETTQYCQWYLDTLDIGSSPICDNTESEVFC